MSVDFVIPKDGITYYVDTKGSKKHVDPVSRLKYNLLKHQLNPEKTAILFVYQEDLKVLVKMLGYRMVDDFWTKLRAMDRF